MHPRTAATLEELRGAEWFSRVGVRDTATATVLSSWQQASESCAGLAWIATQHAAVDQHYRRIRERSSSEHASWNEVVLLVRPTVISLVHDKTQTVVREFGLSKPFVNAVAWDVLHVCMEAEFADLDSPGFFANQAYWYKAGHFPCGWEGAFPNGRPVIF
jgi:hypothetical protein